MIMQVHRLINHPVDSNCFVLEGDIDNRCIVIDPGTEDCKELFTFLEERKLTVQYIFLTHEHIDHIIGCKALKEHYPKAQLVCSDLCAKNLNDTRMNLSRLAEQFTPRNSFPKADLVYTEKLDTKWQGIKACFFKATGHSPGSSHALIGSSLFVGDTYIYHYKTTTTLPGASKQELVKTFESLIDDFQDEKITVYPGHFDSCTPAEMREELLPQAEKMRNILKKKGL